jgi:hypothetical protein
MAKGRLAAIALALALALPVRAEVLSEILPPNWTQLRPQQRQILAPLQSEWDSLDDARRNKWLRIADRYPRMAAEEQRRVQTRMKQWTDLTPEQRRRARERYQRLQNISPKQRQGLKEKWQEYESLPEAEKRRLKEGNKPRRIDRGKGPRSASSNPAPTKKESASPAPAPTAQPPQDGVSVTNSPTEAASPDSRSSIEFGTSSPRGSAHEELAIPRPSHGD